MKRIEQKSEKDKKNIIIFGNSAKSMITFRFGIIQKLIEGGYRVHCIAPGMNAAQKSELHDLGATPHAISLSRDSLSPIKAISSGYHIIRLLKSINPDVLFAYTAKPIVLGFLATRFLKATNFIIMFEGLGYVFREVPKTNIKARMLRRFISGLYRLAINRSKLAVFLNEQDAQELGADRFVENGKTLILGGIGVNLDDFAAQPPFVTPLTFTFIGRMLEEKGIKDFVEAAKIIKRNNPEVRFLALGSVDMNPSTLTASQISTLAKARVVDFLGEVNVRPYFKETSVFVLPSFYREGVPLSTQEAMAMARPIITTNEVGCRDTITDKYNGFMVEKNNPAMIAAAMQKFIDDPNLISVMGKNSRLEAEKKFDAHKKDLILMDAMERSIG